MGLAFEPRRGIWVPTEGAVNANRLRFLDEKLADRYRQHARLLKQIETIQEERRLLVVEMEVLCDLQIVPLVPSADSSGGGNEGSDGTNVGETRGTTPFSTTTTDGGDLSQA